MFIKKLTEGESAPVYYGRAYTDYMRKREVVAIMPLNWVIGLGRKAYYAIAKGPRDEMIRNIVADAHQEGFGQGLKMGIKIASVGKL